MITAATSNADDLARIQATIIGLVSANPGCGFMDLRRELQGGAVPGLVIREIHNLIGENKLSYEPSRGLRRVP